MPRSHRETLPVALHLAGRPVLVLGGGDEARDKIGSLRRAGARVTLVAETVLAALAAAARRGQLSWFARSFVESDLVGAHLVMLTEPDEPLARRLAALRRRYSYWLWAVDLPDCSDLFLVSTLRRGPLQIGISTGGGAPLFARRMRQALEAGLDPELGDFVRELAELRASLRDFPKAERSRRLAEALDGFAMDVRVSYPAGNDQQRPARAPQARIGRRPSDLE